MNDFSRRVWFDCECTDVGHAMCITHFPSQDGDSSLDDGELYFDLQLQPETRIWKRVVNAVKYVFGKERRNDYWSATLISRKQAKEICAILNEYIAEEAVEGRP